MIQDLVDPSLGVVESGRPLSKRFRGGGDRPSWFSSFPLHTPSRIIEGS
jgi:hypothetical protein